MKRVLLLPVLVLALTRVALATPVIDAHEYYLLPGQSGTVVVTVAGGDLIECLDLCLQIGDAGSGPTFVGDIDIVGAGTVFSQSHAGVTTDAVGSRARAASTMTELGVLLPAQGILGTIAISTTASDDGRWVLKLSGVAESVFGPGGVDTTLGPGPNDPIPALNNGYINVWNLHPLTWNKGAAGTWGEVGSWSHAPTYAAHTPNVTTDSIIDSAHTVSLAAAGKTNSLTVSNGQLNLAAGADLTVTTTATVQGAGRMTLAAGALFVADALAVDAGGQFTAADVLSGIDVSVNGGTLECAGLEGAAPTVVGGAAGSLLRTGYVRQDTLTINANGKVEISGGSTSVVNFLQIANGSGGFGWDAGASGGVSAVPEPATWLLMALALLTAAAFWRRRL